jgi:ABC-type Fe3+-siderophore transport system permease subunit
VGGTRETKMITTLIRLIALVATAITYFSTYTLMENLGKNPLAEYGIWGIGSAIVLTIALVYLLNANKEEKDECSKDL